MLEELRRSEALEAAEVELEGPKEPISQLKERAEQNEASQPQKQSDGQTSLFEDFTTRDGLEVDE